MRKGLTAREPGWSVMAAWLALVPATVAIVDRLVSEGVLRMVLEVVGVVAGFAMTSRWYHRNRIALDLARARPPGRPTGRVLPFAPRRRAGRARPAPGSIGR